MTRTTSEITLWDLRTETYRPHPLHGADRTYPETNCYADMLIELMHARGAEPRAMFGYVVETAWEGDQFTYAKPPYGDLTRLYGVEIHEMLPYLTVPEHIEQQLRRGRTLLVELDSWYLPDTMGTSYRRQHLKTTVAPAAIDRAGERLRYFHNGGLFELGGEDYRGAFRLMDHFTDDVMYPFTELVRFDVAPRPEGDKLRAVAEGLLREHLERRPSENPFDAWRDALNNDLERLLGGDSDDVHAYAFVTARMAGSAIELLADHVIWLFDTDGESISASLRTIVEQTKAFSFRLARGRPFDPTHMLHVAATAWDEAMTGLESCLT